MNCSNPGLPVHHQLPEFTQTHVHGVSDGVQPLYPLSSPSPPALNLYQQQGLFKWVSSLHQVAKVLEFQLQHQSFQWTLRTDLWDELVGSLCSPRDSQESSPTAQFKSINSSALSFFYSPTLTFIHDYWKNLDSILKRRDITLPTKVHIVKAMVFPVVMYECESWTIKKGRSKELMLPSWGAREDSWEPLEQQDQTHQ